MLRHNILIPLDRSEFSRQALSYVRRFLNPNDNDLTLLCVVHSPGGLVAHPPQPVSTAWTNPMYQSEQDIRFASHPIFASQMWENIRAAVEDELAPSIEHLRAEGYTVKLIVWAGDDPVTEITRVVEQEHIDLVVMASHHYSVFRSVFLRSVAERVSRRLSIPVMLVRSPEHKGQEEHDYEDTTDHVAVN